MYVIEKFRFRWLKGHPLKHVFDMLGRKAMAEEPNMLRMVMFVTGWM